MLGVRHMICKCIPNMPAVFLSWCSVSSVVRWSLVTARWSLTCSTPVTAIVSWDCRSFIIENQKSLVSLDCLPSHGGMGSLFSGCCRQCCGLWLSWKLLGGHMWQVVRIMVFQVSQFYYGSHLVMVGWVPFWWSLQNVSKTLHCSSIHSITHSSKSQYAA